MASVSFTIARRGSAIAVLENGSDPITLGTAAPTTANTVQLRVDNAAGWTQTEILLALQRLGEAVEANPDIPVA